MFPAIAAFLLHGFLIKLFVRDPQKRRERLVRNVSAYSSFALSTMRIHVESTGREAAAEENALLVCNHMSWLDLLVIAKVRPAVFVTSIDMGEIFFLCTMAEIGGSVFIERRHRERVGYDVEQIANVLRSGQDVILFPEGTSSN
ncbi:MAG: 1-acyl-sn-glycerol-3-phosphate acyltransferase, partial [Proteobacteria bacterium]